MAKTDTEIQSEPALRVSLAEYDGLVKRLRQKDEELLALSQKLARKRVKTAMSVSPAPQIQPESVKEAPKKAESPHYFSPTEQFCSEKGCGGVNSDFKMPSLWCKDCGTPEGQKEDADNIEQCPTCGSKNAVVRGPKLA